MLKFRHPDKPTDTTPEFVQGLVEKDWISQSKYDGWRLQVYIDGKMNVEPVFISMHNNSPESIRLLTRVGRQIERKTNVPADLGRQILSLGLPTDTVLDCEFMGPRGDHRPAVYIFDCLAWDGSWLVRSTYEERWRKCLSIDLGNTHLLKFAGTRENNFMAHFNHLKQQWIDGGRGMHICEGIVLKRRSGTLSLKPTSSVKSGHMFKLKYRDIRDKRY